MDDPGTGVEGTSKVLDDMFERNKPEPPESVRDQMDRSGQVTPRKGTMMLDAKRAAARNGMDSAIKHRQYASSVRRRGS